MNMEDAVTGKRLEEILAEQGLSTGFVYGAPQDESWDGVVDREIKLEPKARTKWLMDSLFYQSFSTANTEFPYWYTRKFEECDGDVLEVRRAKALACAYAHTTPTVYPKDLLPGRKTSYLRGGFPMPWLTNSFYLAKEDEFKEQAKTPRPLLTRWHSWEPAAAMWSKTTARSFRWRANLASAPKKCRL